MRTQLSLPVQFGGLGIGDNVAIADAFHIGAAALVVGQAVSFLRAQHATLSDAGAFFSDPSGVSSPRSLYLVGASSIHQALATPTLELDAGANASAPMWAVELRAAHTRVVDECGDAVLEDLAGPLASALKLLPSKRSHVARAGCSAAGAEPASAMRSAADLQAIPHYSEFPLHSMRKVQETPSHGIHKSGRHMHGLSDICHDVKSALGVGVQILTDPSVLVSLPKGSDGRPADVGLFGYGGIRGNTVAVDTTIAPILGVSTSDPTTALRAAERRKIQKYDEGVRNVAGMLRFVPFAVSEFGSLAPHAEAFLAATGSTGATFGRALSQEDRDTLFIGTSSPSGSSDRNSVTPSATRRLHPPVVIFTQSACLPILYSASDTQLLSRDRPNSQPPPEGTSGFVSSSTRFSSGEEPTSPGRDGLTASTSNMGVKSDTVSQTSQGRQPPYLHPHERHPPPQPQPQFRTPLLAGMSRRPPNETRMRELFQMFMREKHQDPGPGAHEVWSPVMMGERVDHRRPHIHGVDGPVLLRQGDKSQRMVEMEKTIYKRESGPPPTAYDAQRSALACTKRRVEMSPVLRYKPTETMQMVSKSKSILDGRHWRDPSLTFAPPPALRPPSAVTGKEAQLCPPRDTAAQVNIPGMEVWEEGAAAAGAVAEELGEFASGLEEAGQGTATSEGADVQALAAEQSDVFPSRAEWLQDEEEQRALEGLLQLSHPEAPSPQPSAGTGSPKLPVLKLDTIIRVESGKPSPLLWDSSSNSVGSYQFDPLARLSTKQHPLPAVPHVKPPPAVMRSSNTQEAPSDWAWNSLKPTSKAGMFSGVGGGAYAAPQRLVRRAALKQRTEVVHSLQQAEMKRHADEVSSWTVPSWVDEYMGDMSASQDMPISSRDGIIGGLQGPRGPSEGGAHAASAAAGEAAGREVAVAMPIPADPELAPRVSELTLKSTFGSVATGWERTGLPAKFSMSDPLVNQPLPRKRILAEGL
eukprot:jgi/Tetstr1/462263/TSEL_000661.t1